MLFITYKGMVGLFLLTQRKQGEWKSLEKLSTPILRQSVILIVIQYYVLLPMLS